jgi:hypothetical protein
LTYFFNTHACSLHKLALFLHLICAGVAFGSSSMAFADYSTLVGKCLPIAVKSGQEFGKSFAIKKD